MHTKFNRVCFSCECDGELKGGGVGAKIATRERSGRGPPLFHALFSPFPWTRIFTISTFVHHNFSFSGWILTSYTSFEGKFIRLWNSVRRVWIECLVWKLQAKNQSQLFMPRRCYLLSRKPPLWQNNTYQERSTEWCLVHIKFTIECRKPHRCSSLGFCRRYGP